MPASNTPGRDPLIGSSCVGRLTDRQRGVLYLICKGFRNKEIAGQLGLSARLVKACISELLLIFDVSNRTELVGSLVLEGLQPPALDW